MLQDLAKIFQAYNSETGKYEPVVLSQGQQEIFDCIIKREPKRVHVMTPTQYGKLVADDVPVLTKDGWKTHGSLVVGDVLYGLYGEEVIVEAVGEKFYANRLVEFSNGAKISVNENHEWFVRRGKRTFDGIVETKKLVGSRKWSVPNIEPLQFIEKKLPLDPYFLGA